jgi:flagellar biosynthesis/type III secretory pathway M-ring protein FliF/YscJ
MFNLLHLGGIILAYIAVAVFAPVFVATESYELAEDLSKKIDQEVKKELGEEENDNNKHN